VASVVCLLVVGGCNLCPSLRATLDEERAEGIKWRQIAVPAWAGADRDGIAETRYVLFGAVAVRSVETTNGGPRGPAMTDKTGINSVGQLPCASDSNVFTWERANRASGEIFDDIITVVDGGKTWITSG